MSWITATSEAELQTKARVLFRHEGKQIALFHIQGETFAVDNRCPHEGYPLKEGTVDSCEKVLTCQWHNWKFDLRSGKSLLGEDHVRVYPVRHTDGDVQIDVSEPDPEEIYTAVMRGMSEAFDRGQYGRLVREVARLITAGIDPMRAVRQMLHFQHDRVEYGTRHSTAALADWLTLHDVFEDTEDQVIAIAEALHHLADDVLREPIYPYSEDVADFDGDRFLAAIEAEDEDALVAMVRGALRDGLRWPDLEYWFTRAAFTHYYSFGHIIIYVTKIGELVGRLGDEVLLDLLLPMVRLFSVGTREDLLPEFRAYGPTLAATSTEFGELPLEEEIPYGSSVNAALAWVSERVPKYRAEAIYQRLLAGNARNMLTFNPQFGRDVHRGVQHNVSWLDFTHALTMSNAIRRQCTSYPEFWSQGLLQLACFLGRNKPYLDGDQDVSQWHVSETDDFFADAVPLITDHGLSEPIFSCHLLKTTLAVREEAMLYPELREVLLASLNRFLHSPLKEKHVRRTARQALTLLK